MISVYKSENVLDTVIGSLLPFSPIENRRALLGSKPIVSDSSDSLIKKRELLLFDPNKSCFHLISKVSSSKGSVVQPYTLYIPAEGASSVQDSKLSCSQPDETCQVIESEGVVSDNNEIIDSKHMLSSYLCKVLLVNKIYKTTYKTVVSAHKVFSFVL